MGVERQKARVTVAGLTRRATGNGLRATERLAVAPVDQPTGPAGPNKPMVATATTSLGINSRELGRRHIGQPLGSPERREERRAP